MKNFLKLLPTVMCVFVIACSNEAGLSTNQPEQLRNFSDSKEFKTLHSNFPLLASNINASSFTEGVENGIPYYNVKSYSDKKHFGSLTFFRNNNGKYYVIVEEYNYNTNHEINKFNYKSIDNELIYSFNAEKIDEVHYYLTADSKSFETNISSDQERSWWRCQRECLGDVFSACFGDFDCGMTCGILLGACADSVALSCSIWCAMDTDNDLTPNK